MRKPGLDWNDTTAVAAAIVTTLLLCSSIIPLTAAASNGEPYLDEFNYDQTVGKSFGPAEWGQVRCGTDPQQCRGWPDAWEMAIDWELNENAW